VDAAINDACGIQRLPSGNTMIASYRIGKDGVRLVEVSPEKKVVWKWQANVDECAPFPGAGRRWHRRAPGRRCGDFHARKSERVMAPVWWMPRYNRPGSFV
jgi:hypothetical protein